MNKFKRKITTILFALMMIFSVMNVQASNDRVYVVAVCRDANAVEIIDGDSMKSLARIPVGDAPHEAIVSADGRTAYVTNYGTKEKPGNSLSIVDLAALKETKRVDLGDLTRPHGLQEVGGKIYFTAEAVKSVARFDPASGKVDWRANTDQIASHMLAVSVDGKRIYTANIASNSVTAIDAKGAEAKAVQIPVGNQPEGIALSPDGKTLWIGHRAAGLISVIDTATNKVTETLTAGQMPLRLSYAPDGKRVYAVSPQEGAVVVFDAATRKETGRIKIDGAPVGLAVAPDSKRIFITDLKNGKVFALDAQKLAVLGSTAVETLSDGIGLAFAATSAATAAAKTSATDDLAQKILAKARAAMGDEAKLKTVESLAAEGTYKREGGGRTSDGGLNLYFNRSGQYARSEFFTPPQGGKVFFDRVLDGEKGWLKPRVEGNDTAQFTGFDDEKGQEEERGRMFIDYHAQLLAFLLVAPPSQIDFAYAGKLTVGDATFEVVEARGQKNFAAKLFFEPNTFRLAKLTYRGYLQRPAGSKRVNRKPDGSIPDEAGNQPVENKNSQDEEITLTVAEYKSVDGISLPHRVTKSVADGAREIWELKTFRLNASKANGLK